MEDSIEVIARYVALSVPITVAITSMAKLTFEWMNQRHAINTARVDQAHQITTHYLNKALDPTVPLAIRYQLLRFLATSDKNGSRLSEWAKTELARVEVIIEDANQSFALAEKELLTAKTTAEIAAAEKKLSAASYKKSSLTEAAKAPPISPAALKAGLIEEKELGALSFPNTDLKGVTLAYRNLRGSNFTGSSFEGGRLQGCDLRDISFYEADLRGARFVGADCTGAGFEKARLEGADFTDCKLDRVDLRATYDADTKWPHDFKPDALGGVYLKA